MLDLVVRGDLVLPERVLKDGYLVIQDGTIGAVGAGDAPEAAQTSTSAAASFFPGPSTVRFTRAAPKALPFSLSHLLWSRCSDPLM